MTSTQAQPPPIALTDRDAVVARTFARNGEPADPRLEWLVDGLRTVMIDEGYLERGSPGPDVQVVLHAVDAGHPRPYRRKNAPTFVVAIAHLRERPADVLRSGYPLLVRGLANLAVMVSDGPSGVAATS